VTTTVSGSSTTRTTLPPLPLEDWEQTRETLHLWVQIVGKVRMATSPPRNHWWHDQAGSGLAGWDRDELRSAWCPEPMELAEILGG
jgi:hypothetical protein